jgi:hypothetical protein
LERFVDCGERSELIDAQNQVFDLQVLVRYWKILEIKTKIGFNAKRVIFKGFIESFSLFF